MFSSLCAHVQRALVICCFSFMVVVGLLPANALLFFRRRDQPRLLPDKMMRSKDLTPAVRGIGGSCIPGNDGSRSNGGKQRENLLPSRSIRSDETLLFGVRDLHDDPHAGEVRPISVPAAPDVTQVRSWRNPHGVKLVRNDPPLIELVAYHIVKIVRDSPTPAERRTDNDDRL